MTPKKRLAIHDHAAEASQFKRRAIFTFVCVVALFGVLLTNLYHLQVTAYADYTTRSNDNRIRVEPIAPGRGLIYDRNGVLLAENQPVFSLELIPEQVDNVRQTLSQLSSVIPLSDEEQADFLEALKFHQRFKPLTLKNNLTEKEVAAFSVNQHRFPGIRVEAGLKRFYPYGDLLTHVLGFVGKINTKDRAALEKDGTWPDYAASKDIGKQGVEKYYETILHGKSGHQEKEVNNRGRTIRTLKTIAPEPGKDIYLTLDLKLQQRAMDLLDGRRGTIVAIDPRDGGVLAMVSSPSYDPNLFVQGISSKDYRALLNDRARPLINRATQGLYSPASTIKPLMALMGLDAQVITERTRIWDPGYWQMPGVERKWRDWKKWGHGYVDVNRAIVESCDIFFYDMVHKMSIDKIAEFMYQFSFGESTGIDIAEEYNGIMPSTGWKRSRHRQPWYPGDTISIGIGQGYWTVTPLQLANSATILANHGKRPVPHLLKAVSDNNVAIDRPAEELPPIQLRNPRNWDIITQAMQQTASRSRFADASYTAAMKTGTAQVYSVAQDEKYDHDKVAEHLRDNALIIAFAPVEAPKIVISVVLENAGWGGVNAGPVARAMLDEFMLREQPEVAQ